MFSFEKKYFFIAGLPRSGSTLLASILSQNPDVYTSITSPVLPLFRSVYDILAQNDEYASLAPQQAKEQTMRGVFDNYFSFTQKRVVFDTNRLWPNTYYAVKKLFPYTKLVMTVRDIPWIIDSFERARNANPLQLSTIFPKEHDYNVYTRADSLMMDTGIIYNAYFAAKTMWYSEFNKDIVLVDYESLAKNPRETVQRIYSSLGIPQFEHAYDRVESSYSTYDGYLGMPGLHSTRPSVSYQPRRTVLPPEIWQKYSGMEFWKSA